MNQLVRRGFLRQAVAAIAACGLPRPGWGQENRRDFQVSLSERSLTRGLRNGEIDHLDFARIARHEFNIDAIDYASRFFQEHVDDDAYLTMMNKRAADQGVRQVLLLVDNEGPLGAADPKVRADAIRDHRRWVDVAQTLGCRAICLSLRGEGSTREQATRVTEALRVLTEYSTERRVNVLVSNNHGPATDPAWLLDVIKQVDSTRCAAFPLFNGFGERNRYESMAKLMEVSKGVCATSRDFNDEGYETETDFRRMMGVVLDAGYRGYISLEYQGTHMDEVAGIRVTRSLLDRFRKQPT